MKGGYFSALVALLWLTSTIVSAKHDHKEEGPGGPGRITVPDAYNSINIQQWNRTYGPADPQQIHLSFGNEAKFAKVQFATSQPVQGATLKYWPKGNLSNSKPITISSGEDWTFVDGGDAKRPLYLHNIQTKPLAKATIYEYQVGSINNGTTTWSATFEFHTASRTDSFQFIATGDLGLNNAVSMQQLVTLAKSHEYDFITVHGDQAYDMADFDGTKGDEYMNFAQQIYSTVPYLGVTGNHENAYNFSHYKNRFNIVPYKESNAANSLFYSFNYKSLHLVSFSTEVFLKYGADEELQYAINWLEQDLTLANQQRQKRPWIIFMTHHPIYCSVNDSKDCTTQADLIRNGPVDDSGAHWGGLESMLLKHKVDLYLSGHVHNYERTLPLSDNTVRSTSYTNPPSFFCVISGNGGQPEGTVSFSGPHADWSATRYDGYGVSTFSISPTTLELTHHAVNEDGSLGQVMDNVKVVKTAN